jgi:hypothetical protein
MTENDLNIELTPEELSKYNSKKKDDKELPKVYSAGARTSVPISRDMEAFLILEDFDFKNTMADSINTILSESVKSNDDEKELFEEAWDNENEILKNKIADLNSQLGYTSDVKKQLRSSKYVNITDINDLLTSVASEQNVLGIKQRTTQFRMIYLEQFKKKYQVEGTTNEDYVKAARSWLNPLKAY